MTNNFYQIKTEQALLDRLERARPPSREEVDRQRVSFVFGLLDAKSHITKEQVRKYVEEQA